MVVVEALVDVFVNVVVATADVESVFTLSMELGTKDDVDSVDGGGVVVVGNVVLLSLLLAMWLLALNTSAFHTCSLSVSSNNPAKYVNTTRAKRSFLGLTKQFVSVVLCSRL